MCDKYVIHGPALHQPVSSDSVGIQLFNRLVNNATDKPIFVDAVTKEKITFKQLFAETCRLAEALKNFGLKENDAITICSENNVRFYHPVIASLYIGVIIAPVNFAYLEDELANVLKIVKAPVIFCTKMTCGKLLNIQQKCPWIKKLIILDTETPTQSAQPLKDFVEQYSDKYFDEYSFRPVELDTKSHVAAILLSSGTTGFPKGVMLTHHNINMRNAHASDPRLFNKINVTRIGTIPFFHGFGFIVTISSVLNDKMVVVLSRFKEDAFLKAIQDYKISDLMLVPPLVLFLAKHPLVDKYDLSSIKEIASGAAPLGKEVEEAVKKRLNIPHIRQGYGLTEATLAVVQGYLNEEVPGSSGKVLPGLSIKIRHVDTGESLGPNQVGEVCVKGGLVMKGYYNNSKATKESFTEDGWLLTGDLAYYDEKGFFYIVDRLKELIKYKGFQVAPAELEALLLTYPKIRDSAVIGLPDDEAGEVAMAFVAPQAGVKLTEAEVKNFVAGKVSHPKRLHGGVRIVDNIPKSQSGKILRRELRELVKKQRSKL